MKPTNLNITYIGGGSRGWAWGFMADLAMEEQLGGEVRLYDTDQVAAQTNESIGNLLSKRADAKSKFTYKAVEQLEEALKNADFVIISILPGTFQEMDSDVHYPEKYGIYQSVGDTAGPGGMIRALRTIPMFVEIAEAIRAYAPKAWVINYTNPMSLCVRTLYHVFPQIKAFGCCHEVFGTQKLLKHMLETEYGYTKVKRSDIQVNVLGINHFTWFDAASYQGVDLFPYYTQYAKTHALTGVEEKDENWMNASFLCKHRVKFDLFLKYGWIAAAGDRHLAEFVAGDSYLKTPDTVEQWNFGLTTVDWRKAEQRSKINRSNRLAKGEETLELKESGEEGMLLIKALCGLNRFISNVNIPNTHLQINNLPAEAVVETNAVIERDQIRPVFAGELSPEILELTLPHVQNHERILQAALTGKQELVEEAFLNDPLIHGRLDEKERKEMVSTMIQQTKTYLPSIWK